MYRRPASKAGQCEDEGVTDGMAHVGRVELEGDIRGRGTRPGDDMSLCYSNLTRTHPFCSGYQATHDSL